MMKEKAYSRLLHFNFFDLGLEKMYCQLKDTECPFCNCDKLSEIIDEDTTILLVNNKFSVYVNTYQTVLMETENCDADTSTYDNNYMKKIITFGTNHWLEMEHSGIFKYVLFGCSIAQTSDRIDSLAEEIQQADYNKMDIENGS